MSPDDRRPFRGAPFDRGRSDRPMGDRPMGDRPMGDRPVGDRPGGDRPSGDRPQFGAPAGRPFVRPVTRGGDLPPLQHSVRIRDGERELEVSGAPAFVRQILDDLPALLGRLHGEPSGRTAISMPAPPQTAPVVDHIDTPPADEADPAPGASPPALDHGAMVNGHGDADASTIDVEAEILSVLRTSTRPLAVSVIRELLPSSVTGQQVRRILERADTRVKVSGERPATYSLR